MYTLEEKKKRRKKRGGSKFQETTINVRRTSKHVNMRTVKSIKKRLVAQADICHTLSTQTNTSLQLVMCFISGQATISSKNVLLAQTERADTNLHQLLLLFKLACRVYGGERWQTQHRNKEEKKKRKERQQQPKKDNTILHNALQYSHTGPVKDKGYMCFTWS